MGSGLGHAEAFPKRSTQCIVRYSENKGYASNPRRFLYGCAFTQSDEYVYFAFHNENKLLWLGQ